MAATTGTTYMLGISMNNSTGQVKSGNSGSRIKAPVKLRSTVFPLIGCRRGKTMTGKDTFVRGYCRNLFLMGFLVAPSEPRNISDSGCVFIQAAPLEGLGNVESRATDSPEFGCWWRRQESNPRAQHCRRRALPAKVRLHKYIAT